MKMHSQELIVQPELQPSIKKSKDHLNNQI